MKSNPIVDYFSRKETKRVDFNKYYRHYKTGDIYKVLNYLYLNDTLGTDSLPNGASELAKVEGRILVAYSNILNPAVKFSQSVEKFHSEVIKDAPGNWVPRWEPLTAEQVVDILAEKLIER